MKKIKVSRKSNSINKSKIISKKYKRLFKRKKILHIRKRKIFLLGIITIIFIITITIFILFLNQSLKKYKFNLKIANENNQIINYFNLSANMNNVDQFLRNYQRENIEWPINNKVKFRPIMTKKDTKAFCYFMNPKNIYFEFGSGGSTNIASYYNLTVYSVESDISWHNKLNSSGIKANYITIDLKATHKGYPGNGTTIEDWKRYIQAYKPEYNANIILIDGRFRVACALDIFQKIKSDTIILIHDYERTEYHVVEDYYLKLKIWDTLAAFIKKTNIPSIPEDIYNKYLYIQK